MSAQWDVWSIDLAHGRGLVVDEGTKKDMAASAERRNAAAKRLDMANTRFLALPHGRMPTAADLEAARDDG